MVFLPPGLVDPHGPMVVDADLGLYWRPRPEGLFIGWEQALAHDQAPGPPLDPVPADWRYLAQVREHGRRLTAGWEDIPLEDALWHVGQYVAPASADGRPIIGPHPDLAGLYVNTAYEGRGIMADLAKKAEAGRNIIPSTNPSEITRIIAEKQKSLQFTKQSLDAREKSQNLNNQIATGYSGTIHLSSTDAQATLPADYVFTADGGFRGGLTQKSPI